MPPQRPNLDVDQRREAVAGLVLAGRPYRWIADRLGVSRQTIARDVAAIRQVWRERTAAAYGEHVAEVVAKLDVAEAQVMREVQQGDVGAVDQLVKLIRERAKILGLDQPQRLEHTVITEDALDAEIAQLQAQLDGAEQG